MSLNLSTASLRSLIALTEKREKLTAELASVEKQIATAIGGNTIASPAPRTQKSQARPVKSRGKRGAVKELVLAGLKDAGEAGIAVKHLATKLAIKPQNLHVWFHTTGKKSGLVEAVGKGIYRLKQAVGVETPSSIVKVPTPKAPAKVAKKTRRKKRSAKAASKKART